MSVQRAAIPNRRRYETNEPVPQGIHLRCSRQFYPITGKRLRGRCWRTPESKTAGLCEEPGRCEFVLADF